MSEKHQIVADQDFMILELNFKDDDIVPEGSQVILAEIMKMMTPVIARKGGKIKYFISQYDFVNTGTLLAEITSSS